MTAGWEREFRLTTAIDTIDHDKIRVGDRLPNTGGKCVARAVMLAAKPNAPVARLWHSCVIKHAGSVSRERALDAMDEAMQIHRYMVSDTIKTEEALRPEEKSPGRGPVTSPATYPCIEKTKKPERTDRGEIHVGDTLPGTDDICIARAVIVAIEHMPGARLGMPICELKHADSMSGKEAFDIIEEVVRAERGTGRDAADGAGSKRRPDGRF